MIQEKTMKKNTEKSKIQKSKFTTYKLPQPCEAKYLVVVVDRGMASEINHFISFEEAKRAFEEIAHDYGYEPEEINGSDYHDVSIWEWTEDRYERVEFY